MSITENGEGRQRRQRSDVALNRSRLIEAAASLLGENPSASMASIAAEARLGRGTAYRHFATREELVAAVRRRALDDAEGNQVDALRPAGELANVATTPLSIAEVLNKVPPFQLGEQICAEALRIAGVTSAALYLVDLDGACLQRLAGAASFPERLAVPLAVGPEIPREGFDSLRAGVDERLPGATVSPLLLRGRALGVLLTVGAASQALRDLALEAAAVIALSDAYTDEIELAQRVRPTTPAAEIQQNLLPPRIVRITGATLAGNVLPGYDIGGDWFDYAENHDRAWVGIADAEGIGPRAAGLAAVLLGAFRAGRHRDFDPAETVLLMHDTLGEVSERPTTATATIACWNAPEARFSWVCCGEVAPMLIDADGELQVLWEGAVPRLGDPSMPRDIEVQHRHLNPGERMLLLSDGVLGRRTVDGGHLGIEGVHAAALKALSRSAAGTLRAIEDVIREEVLDALDDDATLVVFAPTGPQEPLGG